MFEHFYATFRAGWRSHSLRAIGILAVLLVISAWLASGFSGRHPQTVALDVGISGMRLVSVLLVVFWVQDLLAREIDRRTVFIALTYPRARASYLLGRYLGIVAMLAIALLILAVAIYLMVAASGDGYKQAFAVHFGAAYSLTVLYIFIDGTVIAAFAVMLSSLSTTTLLPLVCSAAFALAARSFNQVLAFLADKNGEGADIAHIYVPLIDTISWVLPDLGRLDIRDAALYGHYPDTALMLWPPLAALVYAVVMLALACWVFQRREFA